MVIVRPNPWPDNRKLSGAGIGAADNVTWDPILIGKDLVKINNMLIYHSFLISIVIYLAKPL
jgi:hypothetical protein